MSAMLSPLSPASTLDITTLMDSFSKMLSRGLDKMASQTTSAIQADLQNLGSMIEATEKKVEKTISRANQNTARIQDLEDQLDTAIAKIDDLENHSRRYNFRIRGLPEAVKDTHQAVTSFIKEIIPNIQYHHLELDRAYRALQPPRSDGLPRDVVVKPHLYGVKEEVMRRSRNAEQLCIQGHPIQIFADLSPLTIQRLRALKPLLQILTQKTIKY